MKTWQSQAWSDSNSSNNSNIKQTAIFNNKQYTPETTMSVPPSTSSSSAPTALSAPSQASSNSQNASSYALPVSAGSPHSIASTPSNASAIPSRVNQQSHPPALSAQQSYVQTNPYAPASTLNQGSDVQGSYHHLDPLQPASGAGPVPTPVPTPHQGQAPPIQQQQQQQSQQSHNPFGPGQPYQLPQMSVPGYPVGHNFNSHDQWEHFNQMQTAQNAFGQHQHYPYQQQPQQQQQFAPQAGQSVPISGVASTHALASQQTRQPIPPLSAQQARKSSASSSSSSSKGSRSRKSSIKPSMGEMSGFGQVQSQSKSVTKRSRMGCLTCRQRKKRCCETRPKCTECGRLGLSCTWPEPGTEHKNKPKDVKSEENMIDHEIYGKIKVLRGIVEYRSK